MTLLQQCEAHQSKAWKIECSNIDNPASSFLSRQQVSERFKSVSAAGLREPILPQYKFPSEWQRSRVCSGSFGSYESKATSVLSRPYHDFHRGQKSYGSFSRNLGKDNPLLYNRCFFTSIRHTSRGSFSFTARQRRHLSRGFCTFPSFFDNGGILPHTRT